jgi:hypothetical protein
MKPKIEKGKRGTFWSTKMSPDLSILRKEDKYIVLLTVLALMPCMLAYYYLSGTGEYTAYDLIPLLTLPLFLDGIVIYVKERRWKSFAMMVAVVAALFVLHRLEYIQVTADICSCTFHTDRCNRRGRVAEAIQGCCSIVSCIP